MGCKGDWINECNWSKAHHKLNSKTLALSEQGFIINNQWTRIVKAFPGFRSNDCPYLNHVFLSLSSHIQTPGYNGGSQASDHNGCGCQHHFWNLSWLHPVLLHLALIHFLSDELRSVCFFQPDDIVQFCSQPFRICLTQPQFQRESESNSPPLQGKGWCDETYEERCQHKRVVNNRDSSFKFDKICNIEIK